MLFNSIDFVFFLPIVFILYWLLSNKNLNLQNTLILVSSYVFYGWWDWRFLSLIFISSIIDYSIGLKLDREKVKRNRKLLLAASLVMNLGFLGFFKYYNFFVESFIDSFSFFGLDFGASTLNIVLPVGISFYTFQTLSYSIDIYKGKIKATSNLISFLAFVSFFPQLVAGPIERASHLLPQFNTRRTFDIHNVTSGVKRIIYGLFIKVVVADNAAVFVDQLFLNIQDQTLINLFIGIFLFGIQIYCDFSGYSHIAIGCSKLLGFELMENFRFPYFAKSIGEFWQRWHISLSTWFRDYVYIPLGGNRTSKFRWFINVFITFSVSGMWHGANWTFVIWGMIHSAAFIAEKYLASFAKYLQLSVHNVIRMLLVNLTVFTAWFFFRVDSITQLKFVAQKMITDPMRMLPIGGNSLDLLITGFFIATLILMEQFAFRKGHQIPTFKRYNIIFFIALAEAILLFGAFEKESAFIYFQF